MSELVPAPQNPDGEVFESIKPPARNREVQAAILSTLLAVDDVEYKYIDRLIIFQLANVDWLESSNMKRRPLKILINKNKKALKQTGLIVIESGRWSITEAGALVGDPSPMAQELQDMHQAILSEIEQLYWVPSHSELAPAIVEIVTTQEQKPVGVELINQLLYEQFSPATYPAWEATKSTGSNAMNVISARTFNVLAKLKKTQVLFQPRRHHYDLFENQANYHDPSETFEVVDLRSDQESTRIPGDDLILTKSFSAGPRVLSIKALIDTVGKQPRVDWRELANCLGLNSEIFFPDPINQKSESMILAICSPCAVKTDCFEDALVDPDLVGGYRAGLSHKRIDALANLRQGIDRRIT